MHQFHVWAPKAEKVAVKVNDAVLPMNGPDHYGCWTVDAEAGAGSDYGFLIEDDSMPYPDPRSMWQPNGVHGMSRVYDQAAFEWSDGDFKAPALATGVIYELHVGTFTAEGTLDSAIARLDHLAELGITHIELMPLAAFAGDRGWGYDGVALFAVHEVYGGPDALKRFVDAAHGKGLAVVHDVVYNHFGPVGNYTGKFGPYLLSTLHTAWGGGVNLEGPGSQQVRRFLCDNALMWMRDFHLDGLRLDAVHAFIDRSATHFLEQLSAEVDAYSADSGRDLVLIAESDLNDPRVVTPRERCGLGMDAQWSDDFHHALFTVLSVGPTEGYYADFGKIGQLAKALEKNFVYDGNYSRFRHRAHGRPTGNLSQHKFVVFIQNHDQIGNRAIGDRIFEIVGMDRAKIAAALVLLGPSVPMLFQGEEWAASSPFQYFADHEDPEMAKMVSEGRRKEFAAFGWDPKSIPDPEKRETFEHSKLQWDEVEQGEHADMFSWCRDLIRLRRSTPSLHDGEPGATKVQFDEESRWLQMERGGISVSCNLGEAQVKLPVAEGAMLVLASRGDVTLEAGDLVLAPDTIAVSQGKSDN